MGKKTRFIDTTDSMLKLETNDQIRSNLWFQYRQAPAHSIYPTHGHAWGEFIYAYDGMMEIKIDSQIYVTPPRYGIWLPPNLVHSGINRMDVKHGTLYVHENLCTKLSDQVGILLISPLVSALFDHLKIEAEQEKLNINPQKDYAAHERILHVVLDQLMSSEHIGSYLPSTNHPLLKRLLDFLHEHPADNTSQKELAERINMTERTLARHCQIELGMTLNEWRQRLKIMKAMSMLHEQKTVESIALDLGYASASAFISMFKRWMNETPDQFRKSHQR